MSHRKGSLTFNEIRAARRALRAGLTWEQVSYRLGYQVPVIVAEIERYLKGQRSPNLSRYHASTGAHRLVPEGRVSRLAQRPPSVPPRDLTAAICGDPPPGRSAADTYAGWKPYEGISLARV